MIRYLHPKTHNSKTFFNNFVLSRVSLSQTLLEILKNLAPRLQNT